MKKNNNRGRLHSKFAFALLTLIWISCTSVTITTANTTTPVMIGSIKKIKSKENITNKGKDFAFDVSSLGYYFFLGGGSNDGTQSETSVKIVSSNEFDGELLVQLDTTKESAEVSKINIGSYSMLNILIGAFHKTWAGIEGKVVAKENLR
jgi:hypothetical protein